MMRNNEQHAPPLGVIATITSGFDSTAKHLWLTLLPIFLDLFFWLGPRLSFRLILERMISFWGEEALTAGINMDLLMQLAPRTNLFTSLSVPLIGVPAFMVGMTPEKTPLATRIVELNSVWVWALLFLLFSVIGLLLMVIYYVLIAHAVRSEGKTGIAMEFKVGHFLTQVGLTWLKLLGLLIVLFVVGFIFYIPLLVVSTVLAAVSLNLAAFILFIGPMIAMWLFFYLIFTPHGLILAGRSLWRAAVESLQLVRWNMFPVMGLLISIILINRVVDWLLVMAENGSWFTIVSILGHAFISTSLVTATFIFYQERHPIFRNAEIGKP